MANPQPPDPYQSTGLLRAQITQTEPGVLKPPTNIIANVVSARSLFERYRIENLKRLDLFAAIEGLAQGNPPYDPMELQQTGLGHIANFNNGDASARLEKAGLGYWNLLNAAENIAKFYFYDDSNPDFQEYATILARNFNKVMREWSSFVRHWCCLSYELVKFGYVSLVWPDEKDWRWKPIQTTRLFLPDQTSTDVDLLTSIFVETSFTVQDLYQIYDTFKDKPKDSSPWNCDTLAAFLIFRANAYARATPVPILTVADLQQRIQNGDITFDQLYTDEVRLVMLLQKEYTGEVSTYIFDRFYTQYLGTSPQDGFMFFVNRQYKTIQEAFALFTSSPGVFTIHSNRGVGHKVFSPCQATMQLDCDIVNMARLSSTPIIQSPSVGAANLEAITIRPGVPTNIGTAQFVQNQLGANINQLVEANQYLLGKLSTNIAYSGDDPEFPDRDVGSVSDSQQRRKDFKEGGVLKNNIAHFYDQLTPVFKNQLFKILNSKDGYPGFEQAQRFKQLSIEQGVPEELFSLDRDGNPKFFYVQPTRVAGDGSTLSVLQGLDAIGPLAPGFSAQGQRNYQKDYVRAAMGDDYVASYLGATEPDETSGGASLAQLENAIMQLGKAPLFSPDNEQKAHVVIHFELGKYLVEQITQGQLTPNDADQVFSQLIPHQNEHLQDVAKNPLLRSFYESVRKPWEQLLKYAQLNRKNAEKQLQAQHDQAIEDQQKTQQIMTDAQRKDFTAQADSVRADRKVQSQVDRAEQASQTRGEVAKEGVVLNAQNQRLKIQLEAQAKDANQEILDKEGTSISPSDFDLPYVNTLPQGGPAGPTGGTNLVEPSNPIGGTRVPPIGATPILPGGV